jgi:hypothetical protein
MAVGGWHSRRGCLCLDKSLEFSGFKPRLAISLKSEALGAVHEVKNEPKYIQKRLLQGGQRSCGMQCDVNTEQASKCRRGSRPAIITGKAAVSSRSVANCCWTSRRGSRGSKHERGAQCNEESLCEWLCQSGIWQGSVHFQKEDCRFQADGE